MFKGHKTKVIQNGGISLLGSFGRTLGPQQSTTKANRQKRIKVFFCKIFLLITKHNITENVYIRLKMYINYTDIMNYKLHIIRC